jgi:arylsulfatase A-like enzyme
MWPRGRKAVIVLTAALLVGTAAFFLLHHAAPRPNIVLLNIDMLRADHLGVHGYPRPTSPNLDRLARQGVWFTAARSHASWTYPSVTSLFTGLYPTSHGARYTQHGENYFTTALAPELRTFPMTLHEHGYTTAAFVTNPLLKRFSGLARGFDVYRDDFVSEWRRDTKDDDQWWLQSMDAENVHHEVLAWLDQQPRQPFFLYVHYIDVHGPYLVTRPYGHPQGSVSADDAETARISGTNESLAIDLYDGALQHVDHEIGQLLRALDQRGILAHTVLIVTADHGEEFGEHNGHGHGHTLYRELLHVPLIIARTDAFPHTRRIDELVSHVDIFPTVMALLGLPPPQPTAGVSLLPLIDGGKQPPGYAVLSEMDNRGRPNWNRGPIPQPLAYALSAQSAQYVIWTPIPLDSRRPRATHEELFDLGNDPKEYRNLANGGPRTVLFRTLMMQRLAEARAVAVAPSTARMDAVTEQRLRALGYVH